MSARIHPLSGQPINGKPVSGKPRAELVAAMGLMRSTRRAQMSFDAARPGSDLDAHFAFADSLDPDSTYSKAVRDTLVKRSRYEQGSNGIYDGSILKHVNRINGATGPQLRMMTGNRNFNELVEREFFKWAQRIHLRRKLWAMCRARVGDGESFAILQTNPALPDVQLDILPIETEQVQTPFGAITERGIIDGIYYDEFDNIVGYDILPQHPGGNRLVMKFDAVFVSAVDVVHWFKLKRPGAHRGVPDYTSALAVGATSRRHREAVVAGAETAADIAALVYSKLNPATDDERYPLAPLTNMELPKRSMLALPEGWEASQMRGEHPNATYAEFTRGQHGELGAPIAQPVNVTAGDSSNYSFASGKLDTLFYREAVDVERQDCNELILDPIFAAWFREWTIVAARRDIPPAHQWDWPKHPIIDETADASATATNLSTGRITLADVLSGDGKDYDDHLSRQALETFGVDDEESIAKCRQINVLRNTPQAAIQYVAQILGVESPGQGQQKRGLVEAIQKIYLGVGRVIDSAEAREILNREFAAGLKIPGPPELGPANPTPEEGAPANASA